jgi:DNA polymerase-3 subunit delta
VAYKDKTTIESQDVVALVKGKFDDNIFNFVDAIAAKNKKLAHHLLTDQLNSGANESYLLAMLIRQFRILLQVKSLTEGQRIVASVVASELKIHPFVAQKALYQIKNFSENKLKEIYSQLLAADAKIKTNLADTKVLFDLLLTKIMN